MPTAIGEDEPVSMVDPILEMLPLFSQSRIAAELAETFEEFLDRREVPFLEDLLNNNLLSEFVRYRSDAGHELMSSAPPSYAGNEQKGLAFVAAGEQRGVRNSKYALAPLVSVTDDKFAHMQASINIANEVSDSRIEGRIATNIA